tara:strand:+ start:1004 stop:4504 length:3501 start_codon:yes stop_codon:yes gene_type:complete
MADCNDAFMRYEQAKERLEALKKLQERNQGALDNLKKKPTGNKKQLKTVVTDEVMDIDQGDWDAKGEADALMMGDPYIQGLVSDGFANGQKPAGEVGQMVDFTRLSPDQENVALLLTVMGVERSNSPKGVKLKETFSQQAASRALFQMAGQTGGDPVKLAKSLEKTFKGIDNLPAAAYNLARARHESSTAFANTIDQVADLIEEGALTDEARFALGNTARWAHYFEQLDAVARRKIGQALNSFKMNVMDEAIELIDINTDITELTFDQITEGSLLQQVLDHVAAGDVMQLRKLAATKRVLAVTQAPINQPRFFGELRKATEFRRNNWYSSISSWGLRNMAGTGFTAGLLTVDDLFTGINRAQKLGMNPVMEWHAASYAGRKMWEATAVSWNNASEAFFHGRSVMSADRLRDLDPMVAQNARQFVHGSLAETWHTFTDPKYHLKNPGYGAAVSLFNLINGSFQVMLGDYVHKLTGTDAGYMTSYKLLGATDEFNRTAAFNWFTHHEMYWKVAEELVGTIDEATGKPPSLEAFEAIVDRRMEDVTFNGAMTNDDLARFRKERNKVTGMPIGDEIPDEQLRLQMMNNLHGVPNAADEIARAGIKRMEDITFTGELPNNQIMNGVQMVRSHPIGTAMMPNFKTLLHGTAMTFNRGLLLDTFKYAFEAIDKGAKGFKQGGIKGAYDEIKDIESRAIARAASSLLLLTGTATLLGAGVLRIAQSSRNDQAGRELEEYVEGRGFYIDLGIGGEMYSSKMQLDSIDLFDVMNLQARILTRMSQKGHTADLEYALKETAAITTDVLDTKSGLRQFMRIMNAFTNRNRFDMGYALQSQLSGVMPYDGFMGNLARMNQEAGVYPEFRRPLSADDAQAIGKSYLGQKLANVARLLGDTFAGNVPYYNDISDRPFKRAWTGATTMTPFGMPRDAAMPFSIVGFSKDPVDLYLMKHGLGERPRAGARVAASAFESDGFVSGLREGQQVPIEGLAERETLKMTSQEEQIYRDAFIEQPANPEKPPTEVLGDNYAERAIDSGVDVLSVLFAVNPKTGELVGRTFREAILVLSRNQEYNDLLAGKVEIGGKTILSGQSPSRSVRPTVPFKSQVDKATGEVVKGRTSARMDPLSLYEPIRQIIKYYDQIALDHMMETSKTFKPRFDAHLDREFGEILRMAANAK